MMAAKKHGFPDDCDCASEELCLFIQAREAREAVAEAAKVSLPKPDFMVYGAAPYQYSGPGYKPDTVLFLLRAAIDTARASTDEGVGK